MYQISRSQCSSFHTNIDYRPTCIYVCSTTIYGTKVCNLYPRVNAHMVCLSVHGACLECYSTDMCPIVIFERPNFLLSRIASLYHGIGIRVQYFLLHLSNFVHAFACTIIFLCCFLLFCSVQVCVSLSVSISPVVAYATLRPISGTVYLTSPMSSHRTLPLTSSYSQAS